MKKWKTVFIRILGILFLIGAMLAEYYGSKDAIINGLELIAVFQFIIGLFLAFASISRFH